MQPDHQTFPNENLFDFKTNLALSNFSVKEERRDTYIHNWPLQPFSHRGSRHYPPCVGPSPTKSPLPFLNSYYPLRNYRGITSKWSPFGPEAPSYPHPRPDCATVSEKLSNCPSYFSHPSRIFQFSARSQRNWPCCSNFPRC